MKNHFFTLDAKEQKEIEMKEASNVVEELGTSVSGVALEGFYTLNELNEVLLKHRKGCVKAEPGEDISDCSDYGRPN